MCQNGETKCMSPIFTEYGGFSDVAYDCGQCDNIYFGITCNDCEASTDQWTACNAVVSSRTFLCYPWGYDEVTAKWTAGEEKIECEVQEAPDACNR